MDNFKLKISRSKNNEKYPLDIVDILINEKNLIDILKGIEFPYANSEGHPQIAGGYMGLPAEDVFFPSEHFLGKPDSQYDYDGKVSVLECTCGNAGCWPFILKITVEEDRIIWSEFEQIYRGADSTGEWKYDKLKPFIFERKQYEDELRKRI